MTQRDLAEVSGLAQSAISRIESGQRRITVEELAALAKHLDISVQALLGQEAGPSRLAAAERLVLEIDAQSDIARRLSELLELGDLVTRVMQLPPPGIAPEFDRIEGEPADQGVELAQRLRAKHALPSGPLRDLYEFGREALLVDVAREPRPNGEVGALVQTGTGLDRVLLSIINSTLHPTEQRASYARLLSLSACRDFDLFAVDPLTGDGDHDQWSISAQRAVAFARELLLPGAAVESSLPRPIRDAAAGTGKAAFDAAAWAVAELAIRFVVPTQFAIEAMVDGQLVSPATTERLRRAKPEELLSHAEDPQAWETIDSDDRGVTAPPQPTADAALAAYQDGLLGLGVLARIWNVDERVMHEQAAAAGYSPDYEKVAFDGEQVTPT